MTGDFSGLAPDLERGLTQLDLHLPEATRAQLLAYLELLERWNRSFNLSAIRDRREMLVRHIFDSLAVLPLIHGERIADIGTGAGLPGIPLALANPALHVLLVDSNGKKARFLREAVRSLDLASRCTVSQARVESLVDDRGYDTVVSRAFASLSDFVNDSRQLLAADGRWLALKGQRPDEELAALPELAQVQSVIELAVPGLAAQRHAIIMARSLSQGLSA